MNEKLKEAFDQIHAEESLKQHTRDYLAREVYSGKRAHRSRPARRLLPAAAAACLLLAAGVCGGWMFFTPTACISIDVNPSFELGINRFDRIISVEGYNEEGEAIAEALDIRYMPYEEAVEAVLENGELAAYLTDDAAVTFTVAGRDTKQSSRILGHVERCTEGHANTYCHAGTAGEMEDAHHAGMSVGKYRAWLALREAGLDLTQEDVQDMTMRQIRDLLEEAGADPDAAASSLPAGNEAGTHHRSEGQHGHGRHGNS